ncbi:GntR family transcriptional regulator [Asaia krungthepensis NRIC 0535]|uniref:GntR family transcriptional regulator n=1 Tax=Asaia krungthepensis NRIC 0535 TaxID=1307925 RepID=A0ABQ0Q3R1_9PROT|nr:GntR family transcriptional regulator [Asaia krungthepensis NRIC 0535]
MPLSPARRQSLVDSALGALREQIASGVWPVGSRIPIEGELAELLQVGRNTVREAIRVLSHAGILEVRQGNGTYVRALEGSDLMPRMLDKTSPQDHVELLTMLEIEAVRLAAIRRTASDLKRIKAGLDAREERHECKSVNVFLDHDVPFYTAIAEASHNSALSQLYTYFLGTAREFARSGAVENSDQGATQSLHHDLYDAIKSSDPIQAVRLAQALLTPDAGRRI